MGVVYKLKPEIKEFILNKRKEEPILGVRKLAALVQEKFNIKLSKSTINLLLKNTNLNMPVGRRKKISLSAQVIVSEEIKSKSSEVKDVSEESQEVKLLAKKEEVSEKSLSFREKEETRITEKEVEERRENLTSSEKEEIYKEKEETALEEESISISSQATKENKENIEDRPLFVAPTGIIFLECADYLLGISNVFKTKIPGFTTREFIYRLYHNLGIENYLLKIKAISEREIRSQFSALLSQAEKEVRYLKINISQDKNIYLDPKFYTIWSNPQIPFEFSGSLYSIKDYVNKYFFKNEPLVLFNTPGYDVPSKDFFNLLSILNEQKEEQIYRLILVGNESEEIEKLSIRISFQHPFIFGLWPWQFGHFRSGRFLSEFKPYYFLPLKKEFFVADIEIKLTQPELNKTFMFRGVALKNVPQEKSKLFILTNINSEMSNQEILEIYLNHWPNVEETFLDFSRKIEFFSYTVNTNKFFIPKDILKELIEETWKELFPKYLQILDLYVRWHFMPKGYEDLNFSLMCQRFYDLKISIEEEKEFQRIKFQIPQNFSFLKDLNYACLKMNECQIYSPENKRMWFMV